MKKTYQDNYRVVIEPRRLGDFGCLSTSDSFGGRSQERIRKEYKERCEEIVAQVTRHVDNVNRTYVESETVAVCEYCGYAWTEDDDKYNGGCCAKDEDNAPPIF
jgi:hypothetical protein